MRGRITVCFALPGNDEVEVEIHYAYTPADEGPVSPTQIDPPQGEEFEILYTVPPFWQEVVEAYGFCDEIREDAQRRIDDDKIEHELSQRRPR
jgi:hypothetical protein